MMLDMILTAEIVGVPVTITLSSPPTEIHFNKSYLPVFTLMK